MVTPNNLTMNLEHRQEALRLLEDKGIIYELRLRNLFVNDKINFGFKTPLGSNKYVVGIKKTILDYITNNKQIFILCMKNPLKLREYVYYVLDPNNHEDMQFMSGHTSEHQYFYYCIPKRNKLRTIEEYLLELKNPKQEKLI